MLLPYVDHRLPKYHTASPFYIGSVAAIGVDLRAYLPDGTITIGPGERARISTGISIAVPPGSYGRIAPRSGLAFNFGIDVLAGVIDADYRGEIAVILINLGSKDFQVGDGDRIAQLILESAEAAVPTEVQSLDLTARGAGGFGSTG